MTNRSLTLLTLAASTLSACGHHHPDKSAVVAEVRNDALGVVAAYNRQDARAAAAYDAPDYVGIYPGAPNTVGPSADEAGMKSQMAQAKVEWQTSPGKVTVSRAGDMGVFEAPYTFVVSVPGAPVAREYGTWVAIFTRQDDGRMKLWRSIASDSPKPIAPDTGNPPRPPKDGS
jgi:ketosteroid isomerase-like protein